MKKSLVAGIAVAALAAVGLAGCSSSSGSDGGKTTVTYSDFISNGGNEKNLQAIVAAFDRATAEASRQIVLWTDQQGFQATRD